MSTSDRWADRIEWAGVIVVGAAILIALTAWGILALINRDGRSRSDDLCTHAEMLYALGDSEWATVEYFCDRR